MSTQPKPANARVLSITPAQLQQAFLAVCQQRRHFPADADIWHFRRHWPARKSGLLAKIQSGDYSFAPQHRLRKQNGQIVHLWAAEDAVVIKLLSAWLQDRLSVSPACVHVKGHGGLKRTVAHIQAKLGDSLCLQNRCQGLLPSHRPIHPAQPDRRSGGRTAAQALLLRHSATHR